MRDVHPQCLRGPASSILLDHAPYNHSRMRLPCVILTGSVAFAVRARKLARARGPGQPRPAQPTSSDPASNEGFAGTQALGFVRGAGVGPSAAGRSSNSIRMSQRPSIDMYKHTTYRLHFPDTDSPIHFCGTPMHARV